MPHLALGVPPLAMTAWVPTTDSRFGNRFSLDFRAGVEEVTTTWGRGNEN